MKSNGLVKATATLGVLFMLGTGLVSCAEPQRQADSTQTVPQERAEPTVPSQLCDSLVVPDTYQDDVNNAAKKSGLQPSTIAAIILTQSDWEVTAQEPQGNARGLALLTPTVWNEYGQGDIFNGHHNIAAFGNYLEHLADTVKGKNGIGADYSDLVIAALVAGEHSVVKAGEIPSTPGVLRYVEMVNKYADQYKNCAKDI